MKKLLILGLILSSQTAISAPIIKTWNNPECGNGGDCEVKSMKIFIDKYVSVKDRFAGNSMAAEIETTKMEHLKKYAFVQYIKGCLFETTNIGGLRMANREFWGVKGVPFLHKNWELDSASDQDPIYWSNPEAGFDPIRGFEIPRNSYYVNSNPSLTENYGSWAGKVSNLRDNKIYASDFPTPSYYEEKNGIITARTSSLQFKICLHKIEDVPVTVEKPQTNIDSAIVCMDWTSAYELNFSKKVFVEKTTLNAACK